MERGLGSGKSNSRRRLVHGNSHPLEPIPDADTRGRTGAGLGHERLAHCPAEPRRVGLERARPNPKRDGEPGRNPARHSRGGHPSSHRAVSVREHLCHCGGRRRRKPGLGHPFQRRNGRQSGTRRRVHGGHDPRARLRSSRDRQPRAQPQPVRSPIQRKSSVFPRGHRPVQQRRAVLQPACGVRGAAFQRHQIQWPDRLKHGDRGFSSLCT